MNAAIDGYIKFTLKCWATRHKPPQELRERLLRQAHLSATARYETPASKISHPGKPPPPEPNSKVFEWLRLLGAYPPAQIYPVRIGPPLRILGQ